MLRAIKLIERELTETKETAQSLVKKATALLGSVKPEEGKPIWVRLKVRRGHPTFSVIWCVVIYYDNKAKKIYTRDITRGRRYMIPKGKFFVAIRGYPLDVQERLWSCEELFGNIRRKIAQLSAARGTLKSYMKESNNGLGSGESNPQPGPGKI